MLHKRHIHIAVFATIALAGSLGCFGDEEPSPSEDRIAESSEVSQSVEFQRDSLIVTEQFRACLDAGGGQEGANVYLRACNPSNRNHRWTYESDSRGTQFRSGTGTCLRAGGAGTRPDMENCNAGERSRWDVVDQPSGFRLRNRGTNLCIDTGGGGVGDFPVMKPCNSVAAISVLWNTENTISFCTGWRFISGESQCDAARPSGTCVCGAVLTSRGQERFFPYRACDIAFRCE
jgi:hypothetical protein